jgi:N-acetylglutamate synthase-like GNAT family acetyltransferase
VSETNAEQTNTTSELVVVRRGTPEDAEATWRMFQAHLNWINVWYQMSQVVQRRDAGSLNLQTDLLRGYPSAIAETDGHIVGYCVTEFREIGILEIRNMYVDDPYRNRGIGTSMLREIEAQCASAEVSCLIAFSSEKYYRDKRCPTNLFKRAGFDIQAVFAQTEMYVKTLAENRDSFSTFATSPAKNEVIRIVPGS